jgi:hypothetical protein
MTSRLIPAAAASLLIALAAFVGGFGTALAQTPNGQPTTGQTAPAQTSGTPAPLAQTPTKPTPAGTQPPAGQSPTTPPPATQSPAGSASGAQVPQVGGQAPDAQGATPAHGSDTDHGTVLMLLDRIARVLDDSTNRKASKSDIVGTSGSDDGRMKVVIDRAELDEMRAEIAQIKVLLQSEPRSSVAFRPREKNEAAR